MSIKEQPDQNEGFVSRWSRRKQTEKAPSEHQLESDVENEDSTRIPLNTVMPSESTGRMSTAVEADRLKEERLKSEEGQAALTDEDMPEIDSLNEASDFTGFMSPGVSDKLRKLALRKLFAGAGFNIRDGLDDYDEDFTNFAPLGDIVTCDMKHRAEVEEEKRLKALAESESEAAELPSDDVPDETLVAEEEPQESPDEGNVEKGTADDRLSRSDDAQPPQKDDRLAAEIDEQQDSTPHS